MLRVELDPNGAFNTTEFGSVKNRSSSGAVCLFSVPPGDGGHPISGRVMATGEHDGRVNPMQSRKMIARLQAATVSGGRCC